MTPAQQRNQMIASAARALALTQPEKAVAPGRLGRLYNFGALTVLHWYERHNPDEVCIDIVAGHKVAAFRVHNAKADPAEQMLEVVSLNTKKMAEWLPLLCAACDRHAPQFKLTIVVTPPGSNAKGSTGKVVKADFKKGRPN